jgi:hypothetical protein
MTFVDVINIIELIWWPALGIYVAVRSRGQAPHWRGLGFTTALVLIAFGISDAVELTTGAWWKPWWLLAWKATCIAALLAATVLRRRFKRRQGRSAPSAVAVNG